MEGDRRRIELMSGLLMSLPGSPIMYYGDEIGMGDNVYLGDRNSVRTPMQWGEAQRRFLGCRPRAAVVTGDFERPLRVSGRQRRTPRRRNATSLLNWTRRPHRDPTLDAGVRPRFDRVPQAPRIIACWRSPARSGGRPCSS